MARTVSINYTVNNFPRATAADDQFAKEDVQVLALAVEEHDHSAGQGLPVQTGGLADGSVTAAKLAADAVETAKIKDLNVTTGKLADGAVTTVKVADGAVTAAKLASDAVETAKIKDGAVTAAKLGTGVPTHPKAWIHSLTDWFNVTMNPGAEGMETLTTLAGAVLERVGNGCIIVPENSDQGQLILTGLLSDWYLYPQVWIAPQGNWWRDSSGDDVVSELYTALGETDGDLVINVKMAATSLNARVVNFQLRVVGAPA